VNDEFIGTDNAKPRDSAGDDMNSLDMGADDGTGLL
jgi:hypothetical protein